VAQTASTRGGGGWSVTAAAVCGGALVVVTSLTVSLLSARNYKHRTDHPRITALNYRLLLDSSQQNWKTDEVKKSRQKLKKKLKLQCSKV